MSRTLHFGVRLFIFVVGAISYYVISRLVVLWLAYAFRPHPWPQKKIGFGNERYEYVDVRPNFAELNANIGHWIVGLALGAAVSALLVAVIYQLCQLCIMEPNRGRRVYTYPEYGSNYRTAATVPVEPWRRRFTSPFVNWPP